MQAVAAGTPSPKQQLLVTVAQDSIMLLGSSTAKTATPLGSFQVDGAEPGAESAFRIDIDKLQHRGQASFGGTGRRYTAHMICYRLHDPCYRIQDTECRMQDAGCRMHPHARYGIQNTEDIM